MSDEAELSRLFTAERAVRMPPELTEQGLARLLPAVAAEAASVPAAAGTLKLAWMAAGKWILAGFVVGLTFSGVAASMGTSEGAPSSAAPSRVDSSRVLTAVVPSPAVDEPTPVANGSATSAPAPVPQRRGAAPTVVDSGPTVPPARFDAELRLITLAKSELDAGRPHLAQAWLAEHAARFPHGVFAIDRQALAVLIGCSERRDATAARDFAARHPASPMLERLRRACGVESESHFVNEERGAVEPTLQEGGK